MALAVRIASDVEHGAVVKQPVEQRDGEDGVREDLVPLAVALVARDDGALAGGVALVDGFEQEGGVLTIERLEAELVELCRVRDYAEAGR